MSENERTLAGDMRDCALDLVAATQDESITPEVANIMYQAATYLRGCAWDHERAQPPVKPPFVLERWGFPVGHSQYRLERMADGYWTPWHIAQQALADTRARMQYEFDKTLESRAQPASGLNVDALAQEIRRVDGAHQLGAAALADALMPFLTAQPASVAYSEEMGEAANQYHARFKYAHPLPARWSWKELWDAMLGERP